MIKRELHDVAANIEVRLGSRVAEGLAEGRVGYRS
jgi:hypothetical protein